MSWRRPPRDAAPRAQDRGGFRRVAPRQDRAGDCIRAQPLVFSLRWPAVTASAAPSPFLARLYRQVPALDSLRNYGPADARSDLIAGLTVAAVAVPQAMAYAMIAGLPAEYGLYTAIVMTAVGALLDSSKQLINGPTNAISIAVLSAIGSVPGQDERIQAAVLLAFMVGSIQLFITLLRLGDLTRYISHSVIVGFTAGASMLLVLDQLKNLLAHRWATPTTISCCFWLTLSEGGGSRRDSGDRLWLIALVLALRWLKARTARDLPELLLVVGVMAASWRGSVSINAASR